MTGAEWAWLVAAIVGLIAVLGVLELLTVAIAGLGDPGETVGPPDGEGALTHGKVEPKGQKRVA